MAAVRNYTNETLPSDAVILTFLNKGLEEVTRQTGGPFLNRGYITNTNQTTVAFDDDVLDIVSANFSMGSANAASTGTSSPTSAGALVYPVTLLTQAEFMDAAAGFPAVGFGPPQAGFIMQDTSAGPSATLPSPPAPLLSIVAGTSAGTAIEVVTTYVNPNGETKISPVADLTPLTTQQVQVTSVPSYQNATGYNVYAGPVGGPYHLQNASPIAIGTNFTIPNPLLSVTTPPVSNTATGAGQGGALQMQLYPAAMIGQLNIYYRARPQLFADTTTNSWTNFDTVGQEAAVVWATMRTLVNRQRADEAKSIWQPEFTGMIEQLKEEFGRRTRPKSGMVRDVANRSFPSSPWWMTS